jgi:hypothetical protein
LTRTSFSPAARLRDPLATYSCLPLCYC